MFFFFSVSKIWTRQISTRPKIRTNDTGLPSYRKGMFFNLKATSFANSKPVLVELEIVKSLEWKLIELLLVSNDIQLT